MIALNDVTSWAKRLLADLCTHWIRLEMVSLFAPLPHPTLRLFLVPVGRVIPGGRCNHYLKLRHRISTRPCTQWTFTATHASAIARLPTPRNRSSTTWAQRGLSSKTLIMAGDMGAASYTTISVG
jgi:hypothetical protein